MIRIKFILGEFKIANGVLIDGGSAVRNLFEQAQLKPIRVSGGLSTGAGGGIRDSLLYI